MEPAPAGSCWTSSSIVSQDEKSLGMIVLMARCTASTNVVSPGAAWGERRPSRQEAGHRGAGRSGGVLRTLPIRLTISGSRWSKNSEALVSIAAIRPISSSVSWKSKTSKFSAIRSRRTDLGMTTTWRWMSHRRTTWATDLP